MLTMAEKTFLALAITLLGIAVIPASSYEVSLVTSPNREKFFIPAGEPFNITCKGLGDDAEHFSSLKWLNKEGQVIPEGIPGTKEEPLNSLTLTFTDPKENESGVYKCVAVHEKKYTLQKSVSITFHSEINALFHSFPLKVRPSILQLENITREEGKEAVFECLGKGVPKPLMSIRRESSNENMINNPEDGIELEVFDDGDYNRLRLKIAKVRRSHDGLYYCKASNAAGVAEKAGRLQVQYNDKKASFQSAGVINVTATSVRFALNVIGPVQSIQVKYGEIRNSTEYLKEFKIGDIYEIKDLIPAGLYNFMFRTNPSSDNQWSRPHRVVLLPNKPEVIFRKIDSGTIKLEWLFKFDDKMRKTIDRHEITYYTVQMEGGNGWKPNTCAITIQIPECTSSSYTISGLGQNVYYEIQLRAHTASGYGESYKQKIFMTDRY